MNTNNIKFRKGHPVRLHAATDLFMRGVVHADITKIGPKWITIYHSLSGTTHRVPHDYAKLNFLKPNGEPFFNA